MGGDEVQEDVQHAVLHLVPGQCDAGGPEEKSDLIHSSKFIRLIYGNVISCTGLRKKI